MKIEFHKLCKNRVTYVSLLTLLLLTILSTFHNLHEYNDQLALSKRLFRGFPDSIALITPMQMWMGWVSEFFSDFYYFVFPFLVSLPVTDTIYKEKMTANRSYQMIRRTQGSYYRQKFIFTFSVAFFFFIIPLVMNVLLSNMITGIWDYSPFTAAYHKVIHGTGHFGDSTSLSFKKDLFSPAIQISPYLYFGMYYFIGAIYAGAYACFGLAVSLFLHNRYLILFAPFCLYMGVALITAVTEVPNLSPSNFLLPSQGGYGLYYATFLIFFLLLFLGSLFLYMGGVKKNRDFLD